MQSVPVNPDKLRICFVIPVTPGISPGQRFRFEHYLPMLKEKGIRFSLKPFFSRKGWDTLYIPGKTISKMLHLIAGFFRRAGLMLRLAPYTHVYLYREAAPAGPAFFEWIIRYVWRKKIIYDFDDAIWLPIMSEQNRFARLLKSFSKVRKICRMSYIVTTGNDFLGSYARKYCNDVRVIPTVVNTKDVHNRLQDQQTDKPVIGWTGTFSTLRYLEIVIPALQRLQAEYEFTFLVIANKNPELPLKNYRFVQWKSETETEDLLRMHIGIMPLYDTDLEKGKCGFKAIQYMALGIPAVVSPVGVNTDIVTDGVNGFIARTPNEWYTALEVLLKDAALRSNFGKKGQERIRQHYSVDATVGKFLNLFS